MTSCVDSPDKATAVDAADLVERVENVGSSPTLSRDFFIHQAMVEEETGRCGGLPPGIAA